MKNLPICQSKLLKREKKCFANFADGLWRYELDLMEGPAAKDQEGQPLREKVPARIIYKEALYDT